ncbi:FAD-dependent oxidoreductase [Blastococcus aurantiacus]|uniref:FAD-dependent oxidoreductase n=1 Tax=Blastococcus aurantiacus TaxID=1550231 RepID=UPI002100FA69|nr:FAD-dependent oxidoreductase [Blastococcus aurantiacus]
MLERFLRPFLAGALLEERLETSSRYLDLLWRSFVRGRIGLPARGMQSIGQQLADRLPAGTVHLGCRVTEVADGVVGTTSGRIDADAVVVATDPGTAAGLLPSVTASAPRQVTTHFHVLPASPWDEPLLVPGRPDGQLVNSAVTRGGRPRARRRDHRPLPPDQRHRHRRPARRAPPAGAAPSGGPGRRALRLRRPPRHPVHPGRHGQRCPHRPGGAAPTAAGLRDVGLTDGPGAPCGPTLGR